MVDANATGDIGEEEFKYYADTIKSRMDIVDKQSKDTKLAIYSHGRQGMLGDNNDPKPGMFEIKEGFKWKAWNKLKGMDKQEARNKFVSIVKPLLPADQHYKQQ
jgi:diazepam-binding inhibitor (GABA receptor modulator, acyl-CoA-binding protein)